MNSENNSIKKPSKRDFPDGDILAQIHISSYMRMISGTSLNLSFFLVIFPCEINLMSEMSGAK